MSCQPRSLGGKPGVWAYICLTANLDCGGIAALTATGSPFPCHSHPWTQEPGPAQEAHFLAPGELIARGVGLKSTIVSGGGRTVWYHLYSSGAHYAEECVGDDCISLGGGG